VRSIQFKVVKQTSIEDCGPTCLYMILKYYRGYEKLETIKKLCKTNKEGTTLYDLKEAAIQLGFQAKCYHSDIEDLQKYVNTPFIAHVLIDQKYYHYVLVYKVAKNKVMLADPKEGRFIKMSISKFETIYLKSILLLYPMQVRKKKQEKIGKWFLTIVKLHKKELLCITLYSCTTFFLELMCVSSFYILFSLAKKQNIHLLQYLLALLLFLYPLKSIFNSICKKKMIECNTRIYTSLKKKFYNWIYALPYNEVKTKNSMELLLKLESLEGVVDYFFDIFFFLLFEGLPFLGIWLILFRRKSIFFSSLLYLIIQLLVSICIERYKNRLSHELKEETSVARRDEIEALSSVPTIDEMQLESIFIERQRNQMDTYLKSYTRKNISYVRCETLLEILNGVGDILLKGLLFCLFSSQKLSLESLLVLFYVFERMKKFISGFSNLYLRHKEVSWALENMNFAMEKKNRLKVESLCLKNVVYPYYGRIRNVSLQVQRKGAILLLGPSGSGKSTLAHILLGDYLCDGRYVNKKATTDRVDGCYVSGEAIIYTTTIMENILLGRTIEKEKLEKILKMTHVDKIIEKHAYIPLLERGENLSSGERQKIILARALVGKFNILVLDEALNRLDQSEELDIMRDLLQMYANDMILVISHRYNLVDLFKRVYTFTPHGQLKKWKGWKSDV
jgi:ABC-type bacteriocin/lantibiotic exporter with double-glycine peptidase domain